ncbi:MAG: AgmX/PglI C-terminal domain-containing protein [Polyangiales bacterium]
MANISISRLAVLGALAALGCGGTTPPPEPPPVEAKEEPKKEKSGGGPAIEYDLGPVDPSIWKQKVDSMKSAWNDCYSSAHDKQEVLEGKLTFTVRTNKDGSVKWAYVKDSDLGHRGVEKCIVDAIKANNYGAPMDAKEGEVQAHSIGWQLDGDARAADPGAQAQVAPSIEKAKGKIESCKKKNDAKGAMTATIYVAKGGKPLSVGLAVADPSADAAVDCVVDVLMGLKYVNKASWPIKVTVTLP